MERPPGVQGLLADRIPLAGKRVLRFRVCDRELTADATSFFQGSASAAEELVRHLDELLGSERRGQLVDLYAGVGIFAACLGEGFERVVAVESDRGAARHLKRNLRRHGVRGEAWAESAEAALRHLPPCETETVIVDPPRIGLSKDARRLLAERKPPRIVAVSCDPATGARDVGELVRAGWKLERLSALDLFPVTAQVETVALLVRS
jgi:tRNA/tmRNA/rRNA uracil-C5-methylase (TrmA/RlmC/RlmD family)